jgi:hypothetical protein
MATSPVALCHPAPALRSSTIPPCTLLQSLLVVSTGFTISRMSKAYCQRVLGAASANYYVSSRPRPTSHRPNLRVPLHGMHVCIHKARQVILGRQKM